MGFMSMLQVAPVRGWRGMALPVRAKSEVRMRAAILVMLTVTSG